ATQVESRGGKLSFSVAGARMSVRVWGRHYLSSALAAVAVGRIFCLTSHEIAFGLGHFEAPPMRCQINRLDGATIIDDTYNARPTAMRAALELLRDFDAPGRRIVVCGDMRELGDAAMQLHRKLGDQIVTVCGADALLACGDYAPVVVSAAQAAGMPRGQMVAFRPVEEGIGPWKQWVRPGDVVLVKGSRAVAMERVVQSLREREPAFTA